MKLSTIQWVILAAVSAAFAIGAVLISGSSDDTGDGSAGDGYDPIVWCQAASAVSSRADVLDPTFSGDPSSEMINLDRAINEAIPVAPNDVGADLARMLDWSIDVNAELAKGTSLPDSISLTLQFVDRPRLDAALASINVQMSACGHPGVPTAG